MLIWLKNQGKVRYRTFQLRNAARAALAVEKGDLIWQVNDAEGAEDMLEALHRSLCVTMRVSKDNSSTASSAHFEELSDAAYSDMADETLQQPQFEFASYHRPTAEEKQKAEAIAEAFFDDV